MFDGDGDGDGDEAETVGELSEAELLAAQMRSGMRCPQCACCDLRAWSTRRRANRVVRVRICRNCGRRVTTVEKLLEEN